MSLRKFVRALEADSRRRHRSRVRQLRLEHREAVRASREVQRQLKADAKAKELEDAATEVANFEEYLGLIVSVHKESGEAWNWKALATAAAPSSPEKDTSLEAAARAAIEEYAPGFLDRTLGRAKKRRIELEKALSYAIAADIKKHEEAMRDHEEAQATWDARRRIGERIIAGDVAAFRQAIKHAEPFEELDSYDTEVDFSVVDADAVVVECKITDSEVVPAEEVKLTASGKISRKAMPASKYWSLYQDYVASCAIRVARETLAVLPVSRVIVNIGTVRLDSSTGHEGMVTLLTAGFVRNTLERLNFDAIDPSDALKNFPHRIKFKKTAGFEPIEPITLDENWVTTE